MSYSLLCIPYAVLHFLPCSNYDLVQPRTDSLQTFSVFSLYSEVFCCWNVLSSLVFCAIFILGLVEFSLHIIPFPVEWAMDSQGLGLQHFCICGAPIKRVLCLRIHFSLCIQSILPGNGSHICREDSGVTLFRDCPSWCLSGILQPCMLIATEEGSVISQSVPLAATCTGEQYKSESSVYQSTFCIREEKHPDGNSADQKDECWLQIFGLSTMELEQEGILAFVLYFPQVFVCKWWWTVSAGTSLLRGLANSIFDSELRKDS